MSNGFELVSNGFFGFLMVSNGLFEVLQWSLGGSLMFSRVANGF